MPAGAPTEFNLYIRSSREPLERPPSRKLISWKRALVYTFVVLAASAAASAAVAAGADAGGGPNADGGSDGGGGRISLPSTCPCTSDDSVLPIESSRVPSP